MSNRFKRYAGVASVVAALTAAAGCDDFLEVRNPTVVDAATIDPAADLGTFSQSARQNFSVAYGWLAVYGGWFTYEAYVGDSFPTRNEFGQRNIDYTNTSLLSDTWNPIALAVSSNERVLTIARNNNVVDGNLNYARSSLFAGYSILFMADHFCEGAVGDGTAPGQRVSREQMLTLAAERFQEAIRVGGGITTGANATEAGQIVNTARVGLARTHLQAGRHAEALAAANEVPADFVYHFGFQDDPNFRIRLGNRPYWFTLTREALVVPTAYRQMDDPRIRFDDAGRVAQDGILQFVRQQKFTTWTAPMRLASGLEARYIAAEAQLKQNNTAPALALIAERRTAGNQGAFAETTSNAILTELMGQKSRDFWLEAQRMGDFRRNPGNIPNFLPDFGAYYKEIQGGRIAQDTCFPVPRQEVDNNPNFS